MIQTKVNLLRIACVLLTIGIACAAVLRNTQPREVLSIQPVLIYPKPRENLYQARNLQDDDNDVIYIKLLARKSAYRPQLLQEPPEENSVQPMQQKIKNIFYVKAKANGVFSAQRLNVFRIPEFYTINVYPQDVEDNSE